MPNTSGSTKKQNAESKEKKASGTTSNNTNNNASNNNNSGCSMKSPSSCISNLSGGSSSRARKSKKRCDVNFNVSELESEFVDCNLDDAIAIEKKLRKVAKNNSLSDEEMRKLLQKFVKNEHVLALVTLKAEDELAREQTEAEQRAIIITDTPSVPKLTRAKAKELNKSPGISLPPLKNDAYPKMEIATLINDELQSDEEDEEYTFKEEDFVSDEDPNATVSDMDSNPCTPQTPSTNAEYEDSPVKFTDDGCFKIPLDKPKDTESELRIAARTRSKLCLQETTIEDLQSRFVPPDVEQLDLSEMDLTTTDDDWMQFLNDFSKPMSNSIVYDDDDPINDPEYVAAEKVTVDAEELRDINISKKELTELVAELFEGLLSENVSLDSIELETPQKFLAANASDGLNTPHVSPHKANKSMISEPVPNNSNAEVVARNIDFSNCATYPAVPLPNSSYVQQPVEYSNFPSQTVTYVPLSEPPPLIYNNSYYGPTYNAIPAYNPQPHYYNQPQIYVPVAVQPNNLPPPPLAPLTPDIKQQEETASQQKPKDTRYTTPYDANFTWEYISVRRHIFNEYVDRFENLRNVKPSKSPAVNEDEPNTHGFTAYQHDLLQQQLRIHVQMLTQSFLQTYSHPDFWKLSTQPKEMLLELQAKAEKDASFQAWNLKGAVNLIDKWEQDLSVDNNENREMMQFIHREIELTNRNTRQIPRFPPRILNLILDSEVFMYPQYLPRIPFTSKVLPYHIFSPAESYLLALGLQKYLPSTYTKKKRHAKHESVEMAGNRMCKDLICGKSKRRIVDQIKRLQSEEYYNPVKYFFDHLRAPPMEQTLYGFADNKVLTPRQRYDELPLGWQRFIMEQKAEPDIKKPTKSRSTRKTEAKSAKSATQNTSPVVTVSERARLSYLEFVREAVGEDISLPENLTEAAEPNESATANSIPPPKIITNSPLPKTEHSSIKFLKQEFRRKNVTPSLTINVNYVFGATIPTTAAAGAASTAAICGTTLAPNTTLNTSAGTVNNSSIVSVNSPYNNSWQQLLGSTPIARPALNCSVPAPVVDPNTRAINYTFDYRTQCLKPLETVQPEISETLCKEDSTQRKLTDFYELEETTPSKHWTDINDFTGTPRNKRSPRRNLLSFSKKITTCLQVARSNKRAALKYRRRKRLKRRCYDLLAAYRYHLELQQQRYAHKPLVHRVYKQFKALDLYTKLLKRLSVFCHKAEMNSSMTSSSGSGGQSNATNSPNSLFNKRTRPSMTLPDDDTNAGSRSKKANRQEEYLRQMLMPDTPEDANRKDAIYAFNFYEKVEEVLLSSNRPEACKKFNQILKNFDPSRDKAADLYYRMEKLFLPDHPELAHVFLTFLLPSEAAEIGKFFEHFMVTNATTFINKLNIYFNKQPAQIRKIYNCLNELAEDSDVTMKKVETKILPLLKGNQFLIDWFLQQFPGATPPERILPAPESINMKEVNNTPNGEFMEHVTDLLDSPTQDQHGCQLRYINGRIFYGSKIVLPAKLSFMANYLTEEHTADSSVDFEAPASGCVHGIREQGEKRIADATAVEANAAATDCNSDDNDKSEEEDASKALIIDTTAGEEDSCSSIETCDDATLRAHAMRLNPNYYSSTVFTNSLTSTPNPNPNVMHHHPQHARKTSLNFNDEVLSGQGKLSPRKHNSDVRSLGVTPLTTGQSAFASPNSDAQIRDKRKSPTKKVKSPVSGSTSTLTTTITTVTAMGKGPLARLNLQPMVVVHEQSPTIACSRKLKSLIDAENGDMDDCSTNEEHDNKDRLSIVARAKHDMCTEWTEPTIIEPKQSPAESPQQPASKRPRYISKLENSEDLEFLPENAVIKMDIDSSADEDSRLQHTASVLGSTNTIDHHAVVTPNESDEEYKHDVAASSSDSEQQEQEQQPHQETDDDEESLVQEEQPSTSTQATTAASIRRFATPTPWTREEDKIFLVEMKLSAPTQNHYELFKRIQAKLQNRCLDEIAQRHQFLIDFLAKLQSKRS